MVLDDVSDIPMNRKRKGSENIVLPQGENFDGTLHPQSSLEKQFNVNDIQKIDRELNFGDVSQLSAQKTDFVRAMSPSIEMARRFNKRLGC
jgi:hypothetical protein